MSSVIFQIVGNYTVNNIFSTCYISVQNVINFFIKQQLYVSPCAARPVNIWFEASSRTIKCY